MNAIRNYWHNHRTKTLGLLMTLIGAAQANFASVQQFFSAKEQGLLMASFGILTAILGFINSSDQH